MVQGRSGLESAAKHGVRRNRMGRTKLSRMTRWVLSGGSDYVRVIHGVCEMENSSKSMLSFWALKNL